MILEQNPVGDAGGHGLSDAHVSGAAPSPAGPKRRRGGQLAHDTQKNSAASPAPPSAGGEGHSRTDTRRGDALSLADTIAAIRARHRERVFWMEQRKRSDLSLGAYLRTALGWSLALPTAEREAIRAQAEAVFDAGERYVKTSRKLMAKAEKTGRPPEAYPEMVPELRDWSHIVVPAIEMRGRLDELEAAATKAMAALAAQLPVHEFALTTPGFGPLGLAILIGEAGDLSRYGNPAKLWTRMGVGIKDGHRQGNPGMGASKAAWVEEKYSPSRRSRLYTIGVALAMIAGPYREVYLDRKAYERARAEAEGLIVAPSSKIPKAKKEQFRSLGHIDNRARRYMEKRLLRNLWQAWWAARIGSEPRLAVPLANYAEAAE